jgi:hypothetical protein
MIHLRANLAYGEEVHQSRNIKEQSNTIGYKWVLQHLGFTLRPRILASREVQLEAYSSESFSHLVCPYQVLPQVTLSWAEILDQPVHLFIVVSTGPHETSMGGGHTTVLRKVTSETRFGRNGDDDDDES